jgi:hypothetical protein
MAAVNANSNASTTLAISLIDLLTASNPTVFTRNLGPVVCGVTQTLMQEILLVPPAGITVSLGQVYGLIFFRNLSPSITIIAAVTIPGPSTQNWSLAPGGFLLYNIPTPSNSTLGQPMTSVNFSPQSVITTNTPLEYIFAQVT